MTSGKKITGLVCLVGAGPGDPGLITCRGVERLAHADVVVYDALANIALLDHAPPGAERVFVGKRGGHPALSQDQINDILLQKAQHHSVVVRPQEDLLL